MYCEGIRASITQKANRYKMWSRLTALSAAILPSFITISVLALQSNSAAIVVGILSALLAAISSLLGLEKPYERWALYRKYHRLVAAECTSYRFRTGKYSRVTQPHKLLVQRVTDLELTLHDEWAGLVPNSTQVLSAARGQSIETTSRENAQPQLSGTEPEA
jgi:hypothetical protein